MAAVARQAEQDQNQPHGVEQDQDQQPYIKHASIVGFPGGPAKVIPL